jgi:peptidoglycan/LPS O-acetylase OafA/YrhL
MFTPDGVSIFFVISGYLITTLLLQEYDRKRTISMRSFYVRRAYRIFPPIYAYLAFVLIYARVSHSFMPMSSWLSSVFFVRNYSTAPIVGILTHTWSLAVEEQFYLFWPPLLLFCLSRWGRRGAIVLAVGLIAAAPFLRIATKLSGLWFFVNKGEVMLHTRVDILMFGCLIALATGTSWLERIYRLAARFWWLLVLQFCVFTNILAVRFGHNYTHIFGMSIDGACIAIFLLWTTRNADHPVGRFLDAWLIRWIGVLSYSIYIWQTFFINVSRPILILPMIGIAALASYFLIETPARHLRDFAMRRSRVPDQQVAA